MNYDEIEAYNKRSRMMLEKYNSALSKNQYVKWGNMVARKKGYRKGYEKGRIETVSKVVKNMLKFNMEIPLIREITDLSEKEINSINFNNK